MSLFQTVEREKMLEREREVPHTRHGARKRMHSLPWGEKWENLEASLSARPVRIIITMIKWIRTSRLLMKNSLCEGANLEASLSARPR